MCSKQARCRAVSCTLGETVGVGVMVVGIGNSLRENWALFSSYDTMPPAVRIFLPSTTRAQAQEGWLVYGVQQPRAWTQLP